MRIVILSLILLLSGCSALAFQTLWLRLCGLAFGNSVWAAALTLSSFMGGLALGSAIAARSRLVTGHPLRIYALLELIIALCGIAIIYVLPTAGELLRPLFQLLWEQQPVLSGLRLALAFAILVVPATAMGLTLPVLLEDRALQKYRFGNAISILYGCNTLGGVLGALLTEFWLISAFGLYGSGIVAALTSVSAAAAAWLAVRGTIVEMPGREEAAYVRDWWLGSRWLLISFFTGMTLLCLEVVWFRFLRLYVASSPGAFAVMLAVVLSGIALGSLAAAALPVKASARSLPILLLIGAITTLLSYLLFPLSVVAGTQASHLEHWKEIAKLAIVLMFPVAFVSGMIFPAVAARVHDAFASRMNTVGATTVFNTTGAAIGPLLASFVLLPQMGFQRTLILTGIGYFVLAVLACDRASFSLRRPREWLVSALGTAFVVLLFFFPFQRDELHLASARKPYESDGSRLLMKVEGIADTLQVLRQDFLEAPYAYRLVTNAFSMSGTHPRSQRYMRLFAYLPLTLRAESKDALLLCYGVGVTADALLRDEHVTRLDVVDISKEVFALAGTYADGHMKNPLQDPRVKAFVQDARFFLRASTQRYDLITGEPPPLKVAGTVNLYTREFFSLVRDRLKPGGIVSYWLPIYQVSVEEAKAILGAFREVFPDASVWASSDLEWIMIGTNGSPAKASAEQMRRLWEAPETREDLVRYGLERPEQLPALFVMGPEQIAEITRTTPPLTDAFPKRLNDEPPDLVATHRFAWTFMQAPAALASFAVAGGAASWPAIPDQLLELLFAVRETRYLSALSGSNWMAELDFYLRHSELRTPVLEVLSTDEVKVAIARTAVARAGSSGTEVQTQLLADAIARRDLAAAIGMAEEQIKRDPADNNIFLLTYLYCANGEVTKAEALARQYSDNISDAGFARWLWDYLEGLFGFSPGRAGLVLE